MKQIINRKKKKKFSEIVTLGPFHLHRPFIYNTIDNETIHKI